MQAKFNSKQLVLLAGLLPLVFTAALAVAAEPQKLATAAKQSIHEGSIPTLDWEQRSDWINVKSAGPGGVAGARGDGVQDDTGAIQAALDRIRDGSTIYFPPGAYRITKTLMPPAGRFLGVTLLGHGNATTLAWDGASEGRMFWTRDGLTTARYVGLTWDGRGKAAVGIDHSCLKIFETEIRHQHEAFRNFTEAGIRVGHQQHVATAETLYENCLFEHCRHGVSLRSFNDLDHTFDGCEFRDCSVGVYGGKGTNSYVRNCHFERNSDADIVCIGEAGSSARQCTSRGSKQFLEFGSSVGPYIMEGCSVDGWTNAAGTVTLNGAPVLIFDCAFSHAPSNAPPVSIGNPQQRLILSANYNSTGAELVKQKAASVVINVCQGEIGAVFPSADQSFLKSRVAIPSKVFDAKRDFGAKGDGATDDTSAIVRTIDAARAYGRGAIAYLPAGQFVITRTLKLTGSDFYFGGSGYRTALLWRGPAGGTTIEIRDPDRITLENIAVGHHDCGVGNNAIDILQTGSGKPSSMCYDRVWVWGMYQSKPLARGLRLVNLGSQDKVQFREVNGNLHFTDSAAALIFLRLSYEGTILVEGKSRARGGFIGGAVRLGTVTDPAIWLKDNQSLVISDLYVESSAHHTRLEGDGTLPAGLLVLQGAKFELAKPENNGLEVNDYRGEVLLGPYQFYVGNPIHRFVQRGDAPFALTMLGTIFYNSQPEFHLASGAKLNIVGGYSVGLGQGDVVSAKKGFSDTDVKDAMPQIAHGLDALRMLSIVDRVMNFPEMSPP
jgi:hypothetical protein